MRIAFALSTEAQNRPKREGSEPNAPCSWHRIRAIGALAPEDAEHPSCYLHSADRPLGPISQGEDTGGGLVGRAATKGKQVLCKVLTSAETGRGAFGSARRSPLKAVVWTVVMEAHGATGPIAAVAAH